MNAADEKFLQDICAMREPLQAKLDAALKNAATVPPPGSWIRSYVEPDGTVITEGMFLISKANFAKYSKNFTPPTEPFPE